LPMRMASSRASPNSATTVLSNGATFILAGGQTNGPREC
jgi:hypothetical protein